MRRRTRDLTINAVPRLLKEGRGQGTGADYLPWITVRDVKSWGTCSRVHGWTTNRLHHLLSQIERHWFYVYDWIDKIVDIREQYPLLPVEETLAIARRLGYRHPYDKKHKAPYVLTTDILLDVKHAGSIEQWPIATKFSASLLKRRVREKLEIEKVYWQRRQKTLRYATEKNLPKPLALNVRWIHKARNLPGPRHINEQMIAEIEPLLRRSLTTVGGPFVSVAHQCDLDFKLPPGSCLWLVRHLIAVKRWRVDMQRNLRPSLPLPFLD